MNDEMTREEAIDNLKSIRQRFLNGYGEYTEVEVTIDGFDMQALDMAIKALEQNESAEEWYKLFVEKLEQEPCGDAISRQAVKEQMIKYGFHAPDMTVTEFVEDLPSVTPTDDATLKDIFCIGCEYKEERTGHWIPVSERLPKEENNHYWICTDCGYQCECRWTNVNHFWTNLTTDWHWHIMDIPQYSKVIAWMPLPKPYKAESEG